MDPYKWQVGRPGTLDSISGRPAVQGFSTSISGRPAGEGFSISISGRPAGEGFSISIRGRPADKILEARLVAGRPENCLSTGAKEYLRVNNITAKNPEILLTKHNLRNHPRSCVGTQADISRFWSRDPEMTSFDAYLQIFLVS